MRILKFNRIMRGIKGSMIVASTLQIVIGFSGLWRNVVRFLSPLAAVPLVSLAGFGLYEVAKCVEIGLPHLIILVIFSQYLPHLMRGERHIFDRFAVLFSIVIVWIYAHILTVGEAYKNRPLTTQTSCRTDRAGIIGGAPWISIPYPFQWGAPSFDAGEAFAVMMASFFALVESTGSFIAVSRNAVQLRCPPSVLSRGIDWQAGDIIAYRLLELSSSWCPELSSFRVGKISWFEPESNKIMLVPDPEYPLNLGKKPDEDEDDDDASGQPPQSSLYSEDGSLEIDFPSLVDVRIVKRGDLSEPEGTKTPAANGIPVTSGSGKRADEMQDGSKDGAPVVNNGEIHTPAPANGKKDVWEEISEALSAKKAQLTQEDNWNKKQNSAKRSWSQRTLRSSALGPTMAMLRRENGV